jgi:hypothetical protein
MDRPADHRHGAQSDERRAEGAEWRRRVSLSAQAKWKVPPDRTDPVEILIGQGKTRIAELLPIRYARMKADPFAFLTQRGTYGAKPRPTKTACAQRQVQNERFWQIALVN